MFHLFSYCQLCRRERRCEEKGLRHYEFVGISPQLECDGRILGHSRGSILSTYPLICRECGFLFKTSQTCQKFNPVKPAGKLPSLKEDYPAVVKFKEKKLLS